MNIFGPKLKLIMSTEFAQGTVDPVEAGIQGGLNSGSAGGQASDVSSGGSGGSQKGGEDNTHL